LCHPCFIVQLERLVNAVEEDRRRYPADWRRRDNAKLLAVILDFVLERVPADPADKMFRQGSALGDDRKHWFRAKFGNGRYRLFFRFDSRAKIIIYAWVNDERSLRTYGSRTDAYKVFREMLDKGHPPGSWDRLLEAAKASGAVAGIQRVARRATASESEG
jgi:toxin YhaV